MVDDTTARLLDAVDQILAEHGPGGLTLRRVGTVAGLSHTAAAHHYGDKAGLLTAYVTRAWEAVADALELAVATVDEGEGVERTRLEFAAVAEAYARFALDQPSAFSVMGRLELVNVDTPELWAARERGFFGLAAIVERGQAHGWADGRDALDLLASLWSMVHGFVDLWVGGPLWAPYDGNDLVPTLRRVTLGLVDALGRPT